MTSSIILIICGSSATWNNPTNKQSNRLGYAGVKTTTISWGQIPQRNNIELGTHFKNTRILPFSV